MLSKSNQQCKQSHCSITMDVIREQDMGTPFSVAANLSQWPTAVLQLKDTRLHNVEDVCTWLIHSGSNCHSSELALSFRAVSGSSNTSTSNTCRNIASKNNNFRLPNNILNLIVNPLQMWYHFVFFI